MKKIKNDEYIWSEKYRPRCVDDMIMPEVMRKKFNGYIKEGRFPHILLSSVNPGLGKCLHEDEKMELYVTDEIYELLK